MPLVGKGRTLVLFDLLFFFLIKVRNLCPGDETELLLDLNQTMMSLVTGFWLDLSDS